ncbi:MAG: cyclic nucleotide-binding domain-containing protein, partial [Bacillota bacterium]|nr:cyclic nucleotide-binding domain-containing protein [Bacillota bacterium]
QLVILICPTTPEVEEDAYKQVVTVVGKAGLTAETYRLTAGDLREMQQLLQNAGLNEKAVALLSMSGYANVRNMCLLAASILTADAAILIDDDEVFELPDYVSRAVEFLDDRVYGDIVHGVAGYYLNQKGHYYDDVQPEPWMTYWDRFGSKAKAFDKIIGSQPRLKRTPFAFGGAMTLSKDLFECVPFDPLVTRGEDIDYLINSRMYGFSFFLDNTLSIKHLPEPKSHPQWMRMREDIYRFVYQRAKITSQKDDGNMVPVWPEDFDPYPGEFLKKDLEDKIYRSSVMLSMDYLAQGDTEASQEALKNIHICKHDAKPDFDAFDAYVKTQKQWVKLIRLVRKERYQLRKILEKHNMSSPEILLDHTHHRKMSKMEIYSVMKQLPYSGSFTRQERSQLLDVFFVRTYYEDEILFRSGDFNDTAGIILKGRISIFADVTENENGSPLEIAELTGGDMLGENCLVTETFQMTGMAREFTELLCISKNELNRLLKEEPVLGIKLLKLFLESVSEKVHGINRWIREREEYDYNHVDHSAIQLDDE